MTRYFFITLMFLLILADGSGAGMEGRLETGMVNPGYEEKPAWFKESFLDIREDVAEARAAGRRVLLYFYQDGCPYCAKLLRENLALKGIESKTRSRFDVIAINLWGDLEVTGFTGEITTEKVFASDLRVMFTPTMLFLDQQGRVVLRLNGYYPPHKFDAALDYAVSPDAGRQRFVDYLKERKPAPATGKLHREPGFIAPPYELSAGKRGGNRPLLVMFEQKQCPACDELHLDILQRPAVRNSFSGFDVALLDVWSDTPLSTPVGDKTTIAGWARTLGVAYVPSLLFFDASGREVFRTEAYLRTFHIHAAMDYVLTGAYRTHPNFQRFVQARAERWREQGVILDLMK